ncbi:hypothetical protein D3C77_420670 [compost metagenome]
MPSNTRTVVLTRVFRSVAWGARVMCPASMRAISRMSPISSSKPLAEVKATCSDSRSVWPCSASLIASSSRPMTAFMGVRISWLMVARKVLFARLACSAWSLATRNCSSSR